jgi:hypothetical protein
MKRVLFAVLAFFVVGPALGESPEPAKIRITTWNLEWFPNGSPRQTTLEKQAQRCEAKREFVSQNRSKLCAFASGTSAGGF